MKTSFLCLAGLLLAAPLTAQTDHAQELKAAELLRLSAEKAAAGHETAAAELAEKAMHMLRAEADKHRAQAEAKRAHAEALAMAEQAEALAQLGYISNSQEPKVKAEARGIMIVEGPNGREVIEFTPEMGDLTAQLHSGSEGPMGLFEIAVEEDCGDCEESCETACEESCDAEVECENEWTTDVNARIRMHGDDEIAYLFSPEGNMEFGDHEGGSFFFEHGPQHQDDLHHQLASIQHELEALRHELAMLRAEMGGMSGRGGLLRQSNRGRFPGQMQMRTPRMQFRVAPRMQGGNGQVPHIEMRDMEFGQLHELHGLDLENLHMQLEGIEGLEGIEWPEMEQVFEWSEQAPHEHGAHGQHDVHIERTESSENGAKVESRIKVIINGEVYEGDAARKKLEEMGHVPGVPQMQLRTHVMPTPPVPLTPPAPRGEWRRSGSHDREDL